MLAGLQGPFILSLNDRPEVREVFARFEIEAVQTTYMVGAVHGGGKRSAGEVLFSGGRASTVPVHGDLPTKGE